MTALVTPNPLLRTALILDAAASGAMGLLLLAGAPWLTALFGLPQALLIAAGVVCLIWAAIVGWPARRPQVAAAAVWAIIAVNALWVVESAALLLLGWVEPTRLGTAFVVAQALAVAAFAELQFVGLKRSRRAAAAIA
jgi:hypothetical protein